MGETDLKEGEEGISIRIRQCQFSFPKSYSSLSVEELNRYAATHKWLFDEIVKNSIWSPNKEEIVVAHMNNLEEFVKAHRPHYLEVSAAVLAKNIEDGYTPILKDISEEKKSWNWWS